VESALVWRGVIVIGLTMSFWAKYFMDRNSTEERTPRIVPPVVFTALLVLIFIGATVMSDG